MKFKIFTNWSAEDGCYIARIPTFPGLAAHGKTREVAEHEAREAARAMFEVGKNAK